VGLLVISPIVPRPAFHAQIQEVNVYALTGILPTGHAQAVTDVLEVLAEPSRRRILDALREGELPVGALVDRLAISQPLVSKHLRVLREAGLVEARVDGQRRLYRVRPEPLAELDAWLEPYRRMWRTSLDRLENHLTEGEPHA
jgi:DNA-binding transcriptional ArsR family regulator